jgi:small conductance mechanosensitive channel
MKEYLTDLSHLDHIVAAYAIPFAWKVLGAIAVWVIGGFLVRGLQRLLHLALEKRHVDPTLVRYADSTMGVLLKGLLFLMILSVFGIETTSFSAILAAAGVAIGVAWSGLLSNFAAGVFLILFRPFRVGDSISAAGVTGVVREVGLFATTIDNGDNLRIFVGNNKLFSDNILNYSSNRHRMISFRVQIASQINPEATIVALRAPLERLPGIDRGIPVSGDIAEITPWVTTLVFKVACSHADAGAVTNEGYRQLHAAIREQKLPLPALGDPRLLPTS